MSGTGGDVSWRLDDKMKGGSKGLRKVKLQNQVRLQAPTHLTKKSVFS